MLENYHIKEVVIFKIIFISQLLWIMLFVLEKNKVLINANITLKAIVFILKMLLLLAREPKILQLIKTTDWQIQKI